MDTKEVLLTVVAKLFPQHRSQLKLVKRGWNHDVYRITIASLRESYIAHVGRGARDSGSSLGNTVRILKFLEYAGFAYTARIIYFDDKKDVLIETYVGERDLLPSEFSTEHLRAFARQLAQLHSYNVDDFQLFCRKERLGSVPKHDARKDFKQYGLDRFRLVQETCPDASVIEWIAPRLTENKRVIKTMNASHVHVLWGDIGGNFRAEGSEVYLIDWEHSRIGVGSELGYIKVHSYFSPEQFAFLVKTYAKAAGRSLADILSEIGRDERIIRLNDVIWAAMKWGECRDDPKQARKFQKITTDRMKLYESLFISA